MTGKQLREQLCGSQKYFNLRMEDLRDKVGEPSEVKILTALQRDRGRQVVLMLVPTDRGVIEVFCPIELVNGRETVVDGWVGSELVSDDDSPVDKRPNGIRGIDHLKNLFD